MQRISAANHDDSCRIGRKGVFEIHTKTLRKSNIIALDHSVFISIHAISIRSKETTLLSIMAQWDNSYVWRYISNSTMEPTTNSHLIRDLDEFDLLADFHYRLFISSDSTQSYHEEINRTNEESRESYAGLPLPQRSRGRSLPARLRRSYFLGEPMRRRWDRRITRFNDSISSGFRTPDQSSDEGE
ncbi:hypothetical protein ACOME3_001063 [Neoechinorhynchus agilis]